MKRKVINSKGNSSNVEIFCINKKVHQKKPKVKAWCGECYQFFENSPHAKICINHLSKKCNVIECQKELNKATGKGCIRKFANKNGENRHTLCINEDDIKILNEENKIQNCLGLKREAHSHITKSRANGCLEIKIKDEEQEEIRTINEDELNKEFEKNKDVPGISLNIPDFNSVDNIPQFNYVCSLIDRINSLNFEPKTNKFSLDENLINEFDNIYVNSPDKEKESKDSQADIKSNPKEESLDEFFDRVQKETKISKIVINKIKTSLKKRGILTLKVLRLFRKKHNKWDTLMEDMKRISTQIEGVALVIDSLLSVEE